MCNKQSNQIVRTGLSAPGRMAEERCRNFELCQEEIGALKTLGRVGWRVCVRVWGGSEVFGGPGEEVQGFPGRKAAVQMGGKKELLEGAEPAWQRLLIRSESL